MQWDEEKSEDKTGVNPLTTDFMVQDTFLGALDKAKQEIQVVEQEVVAPAIERKPFVQPDPERQQLEAVSDGIEKVFIHLLPARVREKKDSLYGETYKTIQYGSPTSFEGVILNQTDLFIQVWTDVAEISVGSILYPKTGEKRWWRLQSKEQKASGWLMTALVSDYQPSFAG
jgi:hypothetical protein